MPIIIFILGAIIGSFTSCLALRRLRGESIIYPLSHCDRCLRQLKFYELFPVLSFILAKGRCRCGHKIGLEVFLAELSLAIIYVILYYKYLMSLELVFFMALFALLMEISLIDYYSYSAYVADLALVLFMGILCQFFNYFKGRFYISIGLVQIFLIFTYMFINKLEQTVLGEGDVLIYAGLISYLSPLRSFYLFAMSTWLALVPGLYLKYKGQDKIYLLPFISLSFLINLILK